MTVAPLLLSAWASGCLLADARWRRIPNALSLGGLSFAACWAALTGATPLGTPWLPAALCACGLALPLVALFARGVIGAGDVKLLVAMALLGGPAVLVPTLAVGSLLAGALALAVLRFAPVPDARLPLAVPYGIAFSAGTWGLLA